MKNNLTIVMYHYVRPILGSKNPNIKGLEYVNFIKQLNYLQSHYKIISVEELIYLIDKNKNIPKNLCCLTFDDGFIDHFKYVFPELKKRNIQGTFFPPSQPILKNKMLDVHMIQHILANCKEIELLKNEIIKFCLEASISTSFIEKSKKKYYLKGRFDDSITSYVKKMLQFVIPGNIRTEIIKCLFEKYVGDSQTKFSKKLYMSIKNIKKMIDDGMYFGSHGAEHLWLNRTSFNEQKKDIELSLDFLEHIGAKKKIGLCVILMELIIKTH